MRGIRGGNSSGGMEGELNFIDHSAQLHFLVRYKSQCLEATQNSSLVKSSLKQIFMLFFPSYSGLS